jgi:hypothetical protein
MSLVFVTRQQQANILPRQLNYTSQKTSQVSPKQPQQISNAEQSQAKGLSLRRVMNAPKTGCKSCGG